MSKTLTPITREEKFLEAIAEAVESGGGSGLPDVTASDNGKTLVVEDGAWGATQLPIVIDLSDYPNLLTSLATTMYMAQVKAFNTLGLWVTQRTEFVEDTDEYNEMQAVYDIVAENPTNYALLAQGQLLPIASYNSTSSAIASATTALISAMVCVSMYKESGSGTGFSWYIEAMACIPG